MNSYEKMTHPGERVQIDGKVVPRRCIADPEFRLFQYTAIGEYSRLRFPNAYPEQSTCSSSDFLKKAIKWFARRGVQAECFDKPTSGRFPRKIDISNSN